MDKNEYYAELCNLIDELCKENTETSMVLHRVDPLIHQYMDSGQTYNLTQIWRWCKRADFWHKESNRMFADIKTKSLFIKDFSKDGLKQMIKDVKGCITVTKKSRDALEQIEALINAVD